VEVIGRQLYLPIYRTCGKCGRKIRINSKGEFRAHGWMNPYRVCFGSGWGGDGGVVHWVRPNVTITACCGVDVIDLPMRDKVTFDPRLASCSGMKSGESTIRPAGFTS
jgi:hypothetical protein